MITRQLIDLPVYSGLSTLTRKAQVIEGIRKDHSNNYILRLRIVHFLEGVEQTYLTKEEVYLTASNSAMVNPTTGAYVEKDETGNYPEGSIGEYDYLWNIVEVAKVKTVAELEELYVNSRVEKINAQIYK